MSDSLFPLIRAVKQAHSAPQLIQAVRALAATCQEGSIPTLIAVLSYNNPGAAVAAVDGLIQIGEPAVPALLEQLDQHNYTARSWAIRALAGIGDPRGLVTLLGAATADFAMSVRRAAARGLGAMQWHWFPADLLEVAQEEVLEALLFVAQQDEEWVVRYAAIVGLETLAAAIAPSYTHWRSQIQTQLAHMTESDDSWAVRARACLAHQQLQAGIEVRPPAPVTSPSPLSATDWQQIIETLYARKEQERRSVFWEGDPRRYRELAIAVSHPEA
ncbi:HEAT repeat domain-containing protein [Trichothermofontia sp.]